MAGVAAALELACIELIFATFAFGSEGNKRVALRILLTARPAASSPERESSLG
jgi:hypothetical protein